MTRQVYTVGHSNQSVEALIRLLDQHQIEVVVDTRSRPFSRHTPHFNQGALSATLKQSGRRYSFLGKELGGRPEGSEFYDDEGHVLYWRLARSPDFLRGIELLERSIDRHRIALLCAEENPAACHRRLLIARVLVARAIDVQHIRAGGNLQSEAELRVAEAATQPATAQLSLFGPAEDAVWRSRQSVLPRNPPPDSSNH